MKGRKPSTDNLVLFKDASDGRTLEEKARDAAEQLRPQNLTEEEDWIWSEIAPELFKLGRLRAHHIHTVHEYCAALARLRELRLDLQTAPIAYEVDGRNGKQRKARIEVAQYNECWRQWRALANDLGLNPQAERGLGGRIRDLFDDPADEFVS